MTKEKAIKTLADIIFYVSKLGYIPYDTDDEFCAVNIAKKHIEELLPSFPSDLEEASKKYVSTLCDRVDEGLMIDTTLESAFKAGAEWQKEQDNIISRQAEVERIKTQQMCYEKGQADMKRLMMKGAVEGRVYDFRRIKEIGYSSAKIEFDKIPELDDGDKVRVIVLQKED